MDFTIEIFLMIVFTMITLCMIKVVDYVTKYLSQKKKARRWMKEVIHYPKI